MCIGQIYDLWRNASLLIMSISHLNNNTENERTDLMFVTQSLQLQIVCSTPTIIKCIGMCVTPLLLETFSANSTKKGIYCQGPEWQPREA